MDFLLFLQEGRSSLCDALFSVITLLGEETFFILIGLMFFWCINKKEGYYLLTVGLFGTVLNEKAVGGVCGALLTNLSAWFSNIWFDTSLVGGFFSTIANILPFSHAVKAAQAAAACDYAAIFPDLWYVIAYAVVLTIAAVAVFSAKLKKN